MSKIYVTEPTALLVTAAISGTAAPALASWPTHQWRERLISRNVAPASTATLHASAKTI